MSHPILTPKKLIEVALPLDAINAACAREKSIRHGHPSTLHLWWARRPLAAARAVIFAQMVNAPSWKWELDGREPTNQEKGGATKRRETLFKLLEELVLWENTNNEDVLKRARAEIQRSWEETCEVNKNHPQAAELFNPKKLPAFHDPFAGGGALPLEAQRLGLESYASDLNPVAVTINKAMIEIPPKFAGRPPVSSAASKAKKKQGELDFNNTWPGATGLAEDIRYYGQWMREEAEKQIGNLYPPIEITETMIEDRTDLAKFLGKKLTVIAWIWARTVKSPNPAFSHVDIPLVSNFILSTKTNKEVYISPQIQGDKYEFKLKYGKPTNYSELSNGTRSGKAQDFICLMSGTPVTREYIREQGKIGCLGVRLMAIVVDTGSGRMYLPATKLDESLAHQAENYPVVNESRTSFMSGLTPTRAMITGGVCSAYGLTTWGSIFTPRQIIALTTLCDLIQLAAEKIRSDAVKSGMSDDGTKLNDGGSNATAYAEAICVYLSFAISRSADRGSSLCSWDSSPKMEALRNTFGRQSIPMVWDFAEGNPFSDSSGNWMNNIEWGAKAILQTPALMKGQASQANATTQTITTGKVVSTDPPYYDNIGYADLSDFFYIWLRRSLRRILPDIYGTLTTPKTDELVAISYRHGGKEEAEAFFLNGMTSAMHNLVELAHPAFPVTIYYAFKASETKIDTGTASTGWETFLEAVLRAGFALTGTWPMRTEMSNRMISTGTNALASSIVLVCRRREIAATTIGRREFLRELNAELPKALLEMTQGSVDDKGNIISPVAPVDLSQAIIGPGMAIFSKYAAVLEADGNRMSVKTALQLINRFLAEDDFDRDTQFCLHWFEQQGWTEGAHGVADVLARAKGTSVSGLHEAGVVDSGAGKLRLIKWAELPKDWDPRTDTRTPIWEALHHLIRALNQGGESAAAKLLSAMLDRNEAIRALAYRLYTLCERQGKAEDARAYNELITSWSGIEAAVQTVDAPVQGKLF